MKKLSTYTVLLATVFLISGCSSKQPEVTKASANTSIFNDTPLSTEDHFVISAEIKGELYRVSTQESIASSDTYPLRRHAEKAANTFCREESIDNRPLIVSEFTSTLSYNQGHDPRLEILFVCVENGLLQTKYQKEKAKYQQVVDMKILLDGGTLTQAQFVIERDKVLEADDFQEKISLRQ
jgi:hypothetical protein